MSSSGDFYWARAPREELAQHLLERKEAYYRHIEESGRIGLWRRAIRAFRGYNGGDSSAIQFGGEQGEQVRGQLNHLAAIIQSIHTLITGAPPTTRAIAATSGRKGVDQAAICNKLLDFDRKQNGLDKLLARAALYGMTSGEGWIYQAWDPNAGRPIGTQPNSAGEEVLVYEGDIVTEALHPIDVWRDPDVQLDAGRPMEWIASRRRVNKWSLAAQFPEHRDSILNSRNEVNLGDSTELFDRTTKAGREIDYCYLNEWYHLPSPALPQGRYAWLVGDAVVSDGPCPYEALPVYDMMPDIQEDTCFGFTPMWHLMGPQQTYDAIFSAAISNLETFGVQNIWVKRGDAFDYEQLSSGLNVIQTSTKPEPLQFTKISEDAYKMLDLVRRDLELISGANSVMRGDPQASLKSGAALALVQAVAVQHNSGHHRSYAQLVERVFTGRVKLWQKFVSVPRVAEIIGDDERVAAQEWTGDSVSGVSRVSIEMTNPVFASSEGKKQLAEYLVANGMADRHEFLQVVQTGRLDPIMQRSDSQKRMILRENDLLREGKEVKALWMDTHRLHMREHAVLLDDPEIRFDDEAAQRIFDHITEHRNLLFQTPIELLEAIGEPPPSSPPPGPPSPGGPSPGAEQGPPPQKQKAPVPAVESGQNPMGGPAAGLPNLPNMPAPGDQVNPTAPMGV